MERWEKVKMAVDSPNRTERARNMFELFEEERKIAVDIFKKSGMQTEIKLALSQQRKDARQQNEE